MTFYKNLESQVGVTVYQNDSNDVSKGFRVSVGTTNGVLSLDDARELAEYIWVRLPGHGTELEDEQV